MVIKPPKEWSGQPDHQPGHLWIAVVKWYGKRDAAQSWQEYFSVGLISIGCFRHIKDPTKFGHKEKSLYIDSHVDDGAATGPNKSLEWLPIALESAGIALNWRLLWVGCFCWARILL